VLRADELLIDKIIDQTLATPRVRNPNCLSPADVTRVVVRGGSIGSPASLSLALRRYVIKPSSDAAKFSIAILFSTTAEAGSGVLVSHAGPSGLIRSWA
jgi:hypothetical protein